MCQSLCNYILASSFALLKECLESGEAKCAVPPLDTPRTFSVEMCHNLLTPAEGGGFHHANCRHGAIPQVPEGKFGQRTEKRAVSPAPEP